MAAEAERADGGRYVFVDVRRWRATDPAVPDKPRQELVDEPPTVDPRATHGPVRVRRGPAWE